MNVHEASTPKVMSIIFYDRGVIMECTNGMKKPKIIMQEPALLRVGLRGMPKDFMAKWKGLEEFTNTYTT